MSVPIAAFGLSGMWQSQVGEHLLFEQNEDGTKGDVDVHRLFLFLGFLLLAVGILGTFGLQIVGEEELEDLGSLLVVILLLERRQRRRIIRLHPRPQCRRGS